MRAATKAEVALSGRRAVITGGAGGIGLATARHFATEGARVVVFDRALSTTDDLLEREPALAGSLPIDVSKPDEVAAGFQWADERLGGVDILVANAGISLRQDFLEIAVDDWNSVLATNLTAVFLCAQHAAHRMQASGGGVILATASTNGQVAHPHYAHYNASKAGVILLVRTIARELAPAIRVNAVCPGYVLTAMQEAEYAPQMLDDTNARIPLERHADPHEVAELFAFLASDRASYITGQAIAIDGGELA